jgi:TolB-like protein/class 3 adenylate cyclase
LAADVAGYSKLMEADERATVSLLDTYRTVFQERVAGHGGRIVDTAGDSVLAVFPSAIGAVEAAIEAQEKLHMHNNALPEQSRMHFRIGVNLGDVIEKTDGSIYGSGVNVAARLQGLAEPGSITISEDVFHQVDGKTDLGFQDIGEHEVKNIARPVRAYQMRTDTTPESAAPSTWIRRGTVVAAIGAAVVVLAGGAVVLWQFAERQETVSEQAALPLPDKPSIAVLPFVNMSDDPSQEYFADGMTEDLITDLSKLSGLFVIARNSVFVYKGQAVDVKKVARDLGVRYVLEGSVRRDGDRVRINAQLIDSNDLGHVWSERYDAQLDDIFALQDKVNKNIIDALAVQLSPGDNVRQATPETLSAQAHDAFLQGWAHYLQATPEDYVKAVPLFEQASQRDARYGRAYAALASIYNNARAKGWQAYLGLTPDDAFEKALEYLDISNRYPTPLGHQVSSEFFSNAGKHDEAIAEAARAIELNINDPAGHFAMAKSLAYDGQSRKAIEMIEKAMRLNPYYPPDYLFYLGMGQFGMELFEDAVETLEEARGRVLDDPGILTFLIATYGFLGRATDSTSALAQLHGLGNNAVIDWRLGTTVLDVNIWPFKDPADIERLRAGLRLAGMPEFQDEWGLPRENRLIGDEIQDLVFGRTLQGRHPVSGMEFTVTRAVDGQFTADGLWSDTGVSHVVGNRLCSEWTKYRPSCAVIYRNPNGSHDAGDAYLLIQRSGAYPFSITE